MKNRQILFARRPQGWVTPECFAAGEAAVPEPGPGQFVIRNIYMSLDPYMRGMMNPQRSYAAPLEPGDVMAARVVGQVTASNHADYQEGDYVFAMARWEEYSLLDGSETVRHVDPALAPISWNLGVLGAPGLTAYVGMMVLLGPPEAGQQVFVTSAAGAVGQVAAQLAKLQGAHVVGSAGSDDKVHFLAETIGLDGAFNYKKIESYDAALAEHFPGGIDMYFDNVGGEALEAVLTHAKPFARLPLCGMISRYNEEGGYGIRNLTQVNRMRLTLQGFIVRDHYDLLPDYLQKMAGWLKAGRVKYIEDITQGLENAPDAFIAMLKGGNFGKQVVQIGADPTRS